MSFSRPITSKPSRTKCATDSEPIRPPDPVTIAVDMLWGSLGSLGAAGVLGPLSGRNQPSGGLTRTDGAVSGRQTSPQLSQAVLGLTTGPARPPDDCLPA